MSEIQIENKDNRFFHVTPKRNLQPILSHGLMPKMGERSTKIGEDAARVYLFPSIEEMDNALYNWLGQEFEEEEELLILQLDIPKSFPVYRECDSNGEEFFEEYCEEEIPSKYVTAVYNEEYNCVEQFSQRKSQSKDLELC